MDVTEWFAQVDAAYLLKAASVIWLDVVLSGDNALVVGLAAATLPPHLRRRGLIFGIALATVVRIIFAVMTAYLLGVPGLLFIGGIALLWVAYSLYTELAVMGDGSELVASMDGRATPSAGETSSGSITKAMITIIVADVSMSIDNVLAVAGIAREETEILVFGLVLSVALMGVGATIAMKLLLRYRWISYAGVALLVFIGGRMMYDGWPDAQLLASHTYDTVVAQAVEWRNN